jgi:hypothetical protein
MEWFVMEIFADQRKLCMMESDANPMEFAEETLAKMEVFALRREQFLVSQTLTAVDLLKFVTRLLDPFVELALKVFVVVKSKLQLASEKTTKQLLLLNQFPLLVTNKSQKQFALVFASFVLI